MNSHIVIILRAPKTVDIIIFCPRFFTLQKYILQKIDNLNRKI